MTETVGDNDGEQTSKQQHSTNARTLVLDSAFLINHFIIMASGFGKWYEEKQAEQNGETSSSSWFDTESLPLFSTEGMPGMSLESMRESMEAQMPRKILGMGYQQRFQVGDP
jgi:hypothetical protein